MTSKLIEKPLQDLCLQYIADNFDQLIGNRYDGNMDSFDEPVQLLQRRFSPWLLEKLTATGSLRSEHLTFLINPHLRDLDLRSRVFDDPTVLLERLRVVGRTIIRLNFRKTCYEGSVINEIIQLVPYVEELYLSEKQYDANILKIVGMTCRQIQILHMRYSFVTTEGLRNFCDKNETGDLEPNVVLKELHIGDAPYVHTVRCDAIPYDTIRFALKYFPNLEVLDSESVAAILHKDYRQQVANDCIENLPKYNLTTLRIPDEDDYYSSETHMNYDEHYDVSEILRVCAVLCPNVKTLTAVNMNSPDAAFACCNFSRLKDVSLVGICASQLLHPALRARAELYFGATAIPFSFFLQKCPNLEKLYFRTVKLAKIHDTEETMTFPKITSIIFDSYEIDYNKQEEPILSVIRACSETQELAFPHCRHINDKFIDSLITCKCMGSVRKLDFSFSDLNVGAARKLTFSLPRLEKLIVQKCDMSWLEYKDLVSSANAEKLAVDVVWRVCENESIDSESDHMSEGDLYNF